MTTWLLPSTQDVFAPDRTRIRVAPKCLVDAPGPRQGMVEHGDFVVKDVRIVLVEMEPLLEDRLIVEGQRQPARVVGARPLEGAARLDLKHVVAAVAVLVDPSADRIALIGRLEVLRPVASVGEDAADGVFAVAEQDIGGFRRDDVFLPGPPSCAACRPGGTGRSGNCRVRPWPGRPCCPPRPSDIPASAGPAARVRGTWSDRI